MEIENPNAPGRRCEIVVRDGENAGRDAGKHFRITEKSAVAAEKWARRMLLLLQNNGHTMPPNVTGLGMVGVAIIGINIWLRGNINPEQLEPLMDEMMTCVEVIRDPKHPEICSALIPETDIQEVHTLLWLRSEIVRVHTGFSIAAAFLNLISAIKAVADTSTTKTSPP